MKTRSLTDLVHFTDDGPRTEVLTETSQLWSQVVCLQGAQGVGPMTDADADGIVMVLAGVVAAWCYRPVLGWLMGRGQRDLLARVRR